MRQTQFNRPQGLTAAALCCAGLVLFSNVKAEGFMALAVGAAASSVGVASEVRPISDFQAVSLHGAIDLVIRQGKQEGVEVMAEADLLALLQTVVETGPQGKTLVVRWKRGERIRSHKTSRVVVTVVRLESLALEGAGDARIEGLTTPRLSLSVSGSGDVQVQSLVSDELAIRIAGCGDVTAQGRAQRLRVSIAGSGDVRTDDLVADDVEVSIAGSGDATVQAQKTLVAKVAGSGDVRYRGNANLKSFIAGSGSVSKQ